ncbi:MAG: fibronectin type III domain-containing protein [Methanomassiliicoccales archaeon]|nr:fibronectin type III domain-containing protein [Methanomassiliicoccales archaeon]
MSPAETNDVSGHARRADALEGNVNAVSAPAHRTRAFWRRHPLAVHSVTLLLVLTFLFNSLIPLASVSIGEVPAGGSAAPSISSPQGTYDDFQIGTTSANLTTSVAGNTVTVYAEEYSVKADWSTSFVDYTIRPYFSTDYVRYRRANPQYAGDGITDSSGNALDTVNMRISRWGTTGNTVWFLESCAEFSVNQTFRIYRDYFELDATYAPGTKNVVVTYFIGLYSSSNSLIGLISGGNMYRYVPGYDEATPAGYGLGGWYPSYKMFAPACDMRVPGRNLGVEWGYDETVAYVGSPLWLKDMGGGGDSVFGLKYSSMNSIVPNPSLGASKTFHMFVRPYKYSDGNAQGHDVGYAQWVAPRIAAAYGNHNTPIFPLAVMDTGSWTSAFRSWVENSQVKLATYSNNPGQINWNYKSAQIAGTSNAGPSQVPTAWQLYSTPGTPMLTPEGRVVCNPVSGPYTTSGTYRWHLIQDDANQGWWVGSTGVFWDEMNNWDANNRLRSDYQTRPDFLYIGYLQLVKDSYQSGYWNYVIANPFTGLLHLAIACDISLIEGYEPSTIYGVDMIKHVQSSMDFVNNIPTAYRPKMLVYQNYATSSSADQNDVYSVLFGSARYGYDVELLSYDSYDSQMHNLAMAEEMFKAMGCTRDSDVRIAVGTLDLSTGSTLSTDASMIVTKGAGNPAITFTSAQATYKLSNLWSASNSFSFSIPSSSYYQAGTNVVQSGGVVYSTDGRAKFSGTIGAEKTGSVVANPSLSVMQTSSGTATVTLQSIGSGTASLTVASTGGTTQLVLKGFTAGTSYNLKVNSVTVASAVAAADGSLTFTRSFGSNDQVTIVAGAGGDTVPPQVSQVSPANGATSVAVSGVIGVTFSEAMDKTSAQNAFTLESASSVSGTFTWSNGDKALAFTPSAALTYDTQYTVTISTAAKDVAGHALQSAFQSGFTTEASVPSVHVPTAPLGPASSGGVRSITVTWSAPSDNGGASITSYRLYRSTTSGGEGGTPYATLGSVLSYVDQGLGNGATYYYKVSAVNSVGEGQLSTETAATTKSLPGQPSSVGATGGTRSITVQWSAPSSDGGSAVTSYKLYRGTSSGAETLLANVGLVTSYTDSGLANATTYFYQVSAVNAVGEGSLSTEKSATTLIQVPTAPMQLNAAATSGTITLTWAQPSSNGGGAVSGYKVYRGTSPGGETLLATIGAITSYADQGLQNGLRYYYKVAAVNSAGTGATSSEVSATPTGMPGAPTGLSARATSGYVLLSWNAPADNGGSAITQYRVYRGSSPSQLTLLGTSTTAMFNDTSVGPSLTLYYCVSAVNGNGEGTSSQTITVGTSASVPEAPNITSVSGGDSSVHLEWSAPTNDGGAPIQTYKVQRSTAGGAYSTIAQSSSTSCDDQSVQNGIAYQYKVSAVNSAGEGAASQAVSVTPATTPPAPSGLELVAGDAAVTMSWQAPSSNGGSAITSYLVYRGTSPSSLVQISEVASNSTTDTTAANGVHYFYAVAARNSIGIGPMCPTADCTPIALPSQPTNLVATASGPSIILSFTAPSSDGGSAISGYVILRGTASGGETPIASVGAVSSYSDSSVVAGVTYFYKVAATNAVGTGAASNEASAMVARQSPPGTPAHLSGRYTNGVVQLSWITPSKSTGITSYNVYRGTSFRNFVKIATVGPTTTYNDANVVKGVTYYYRVSAINSAGEGQSSSIAGVYCNPRASHSMLSEPMVAPLAGIDSPAWISLAAIGLCAFGAIVLVPRSQGVQEWWAARRKRR